MQHVAKRNTKGKLYLPHDDEESNVPGTTCQNVVLPTGHYPISGALTPVLDCNGWPVKLVLDAGHLSWAPVDLRNECFPLPLNLPSLLTNHVAGAQHSVYRWWVGCHCAWVAGCPEVGVVEAAVQAALQEVRQVHRPVRTDGQCVDDDDDDGNGMHSVCDDVTYTHRGTPQCQWSTFCAQACAIQPLGALLGAAAWVGGYVTMPGQTLPRHRNVIDLVFDLLGLRV